MSGTRPGPSVGTKAPPFSLLDDAGTRVRLKDFAGQRVILYFYPAAMTPGCTKQACDFRDSLDVLTGHGLAVVGISPDPAPRLAAFRERDQLTFTLLSDPDHAVMEQYGAWGAKQLYGKTVTGVIRSTFVIGPTGRVELAQHNVRATGHVARLLRELDLS
ncbi:MAG: thioredoxin-dependent thiol peroxidase [Actinomycetales bacterium]|nr:thioredoxin-dependent thiol peroxidase [Actinomycetales bacterium]